MGAKFNAGGYLGVTGYSRRENVNIKAPSCTLFQDADPSQKDGWNQIWIIYELTKLGEAQRAPFISVKEIK